AQSRRTKNKWNTILDWLRPLALRQFSQRRVEDCRADPFWPAKTGGHCVYVRRCGCTNEDCMKFPGIRDDLHYAFEHPENMKYISKIALCFFFFLLKGNLAPMFCGQPKRIEEG